MSPTRRWLALAYVLSIVPSASAVLLLALVNNAIARGGSGGAGFGTYALLCAVILVAQYGSSLAMLHVAQAAMLEQRLRLSRQVLAAPLRRLEQIGAGQLLTVLSEDVMALSEATRARSLAVGHVAIIVAALSYLAWLSWTAVIVVGLVIAGGVVYRLIAMAGRRFMTLARRDQGELYRHLRALTAKRHLTTAWAQWGCDRPSVGDTSAAERASLHRPPGQRNSRPRNTDSRYKASPGNR